MSCNEAAPTFGTAGHVGWLQQLQQHSLQQHSCGCDSFKGARRSAADARRPLLPINPKPIHSHVVSQSPTSGPLQFRESFSEEFFLSESAKHILSTAQAEERIGQPFLSLMLAHSLREDEAMWEQVR